MINTCYYLKFYLTFTFCNKNCNHLDINIEIKWSTLQLRIVIRFFAHNKGFFLLNFISYTKFIISIHWLVLQILITNFTCVTNIATSKSVLRLLHDRIDQKIEFIWRKIFCAVFLKYSKIYKNYNDKNIWQRSIDSILHYVHLYTLG